MLRPEFLSNHVIVMHAQRQNTLFPLTLLVLSLSCHICIACTACTVV